MLKLVIKIYPIIEKKTGSGLVLILNLLEYLQKFKVSYLFFTIRNLSFSIFKKKIVREENSLTLKLLKMKIYKLNFDRNE